MDTESEAAKSWTPMFENYRFVAENGATKVEVELENLASQNVTDPTRIAQAVRRTVGKWVGETYRRQPMIVPTVIEI